LHGGILAANLVKIIWYPFDGGGGDTSKKIKKYMNKNIGCNILVVEQKNNLINIYIYIFK
jgi:hypothetical protein